MTITRREMLERVTGVVGAALVGGDRVPVWRMSLLERLSLAAVLIAVLWAAVLWAIHSG